ncbi:MAG: ATP-binding cassette domain-containing protein [Paracoccaceae bacterium]|nr:ATP-binding cassette domain-containing protein [Paracoccaceae bacterium]
MLEISKVSYSYGGNSVFSGVSLSVAPGSFYFLTGPSGSGKTTFINLCAGALIPEVGNISVFGQETRNMSNYELSQMRRRLGIVHQNCEFLDHLSIEENIALPLTVAGMDNIKERANVLELMKWVGLDSKSNVKPQELSGGERQRLALARAVIMSPEIILADEPTGNVDWEMSQRLLTLMIELNKMGKTIFISTHDLSLIRLAKAHVTARTLRISDLKLSQAGADL